MLKTCLNCGAEFDGSPQARFHSDACRKAYSRREPGHGGTSDAELGLVKASELGRPRPNSDTALPERQVNAEEPSPAGRPVEVLLQLDPFAPLTDEEEQALRGHFGYAASETRTRAERETAARKMLEPLSPQERARVQAAIAHNLAMERRSLEKQRLYREGSRL